MYSWQGTPESIESGQPVTAPISIVLYEHHGVAEFAV